MCDNKEILHDAVEEDIVKTLELSLFNKKNIKSLLKRVNESMGNRLAGKSESESLLICVTCFNHAKYITYFILVIL